jgi:hypothetical protein
MALSQYYGQVYGRAKTPRAAIGNKATGLITRARTRDGEIHVKLAWDDDNKTDTYIITLEFYHKKAMKKIILARGSF